MLGQDEDSDKVGSIWVYERVLLSCIGGGHLEICGLSNILSLKEMEKGDF